ncbi:hypothetical protein O6D91_20850 [Cronobacter sakazakii]|uniref:hypothetical protein n=1 Tax=Cronobacter sakazakii TaxID=28141 RepID=UPI001055382F|nr:hypothetical protein [Cronobacter sakazakii]MCZ6132156.1 hypothetical protein [Cronobacter sakazakii]MCZ6139921.1 hypothetical protein [Cronobacter sakazakii]
MSELSYFILMVIGSYAVGLFCSFLQEEICNAGLLLICLTPVSMLTGLIMNLTSANPPLAAIPNAVLAMLATFSAVATGIRFWFYAKPEKHICL